MPPSGRADFAGAAVCAAGPERRSSRQSREGRRLRCRRQAVPALPVRPSAPPARSAGVRGGRVSAPVRVLVADDHVPTRVGVRLALDGQGFVVCAEAADAEEAIAAASRERPDLCLLDIGMPGNGIAAAAEIKLRLPETAIVMLTISRDDNDLFDSLQAGASGYLLK